VRHLFLDHSPITHCVARRVIEREGLDRRRVVLLRPEGAAREDAGVAVRPWLALPRRLPRRLRPFRPEVFLHRVDRYVREVVGEEPFHLYTPLLRKPEQELLASHPQCRGHSLIEEGLASYHTREEIDARLPPRRPGPWVRLRHRGRLGDGSFFGRGHARAYATSPDAFPDLERRVVLDRVFRDDLGDDPQGPLGGGLEELDTVLVTDGLSRRGDVQLDSVLAGLERALARLRERGTARVHWKPHRVQSGGAEEEAFAALLGRSGVAWERLPDELCLEDLAHSAPRVRFLVNLSSCALYAAAAGCEVVSFAGLVAEAEPGFASVIGSLPRAWRRRVRMLGEAPVA